MHWDYVLRLVVAGILGELIGCYKGSTLIMIVSQHGFADVITKPGKPRS